MWSFLNFCMKLHQQKFVKLLFWAKSFFKIFEPHSARMDPKWALLRFMENGPSEFFRLFCIKLQIDFTNFFGRILDLRFFGPKEAQKGLKTTFFKLKSYPWIFFDFFWMKLQQHNDWKSKWMIFLAKYIWFFALTQIIFREKILYQVFLWKGGQKWACLVTLFRVWFFIRNLPYDN